VNQFLAVVANLLASSLYRESFLHPIRFPVLRSIKVARELPKVPEEHAVESSGRLSLIAPDSGTPEPVLRDPKGMHMVRISSQVVAIALMWAATTFACAGESVLYKCTGPSGNPEFSDRPCGTNAKVLGSIRSYTSDEVAAMNRQREAEEHAYRERYKQQQLREAEAGARAAAAMPQPAYIPPTPQFADQTAGGAVESGYVIINGKPYFRSGRKGVVDPKTGRYCPLVGNTYFCN